MDASGFTKGATWKKCRMLHCRLTSHSGGENPQCTILSAQISMVLTFGFDIGAVLGIGEGSYCKTQLSSLVTTLFSTTTSSCNTRSGRSVLSCPMGTWVKARPGRDAAHPASCPMGTGGPFPRGKARPGRDADHPPHLVPMSWMSRSYTSSSPYAFMGVLWDWFTFTHVPTKRNKPLRLWNIYWNHKTKLNLSYVLTLTI
jgi:hypothetical protein